MPGPFINEADYSKILSFLGEGYRNWAFLIFIPIVIAYQVWTYSLFKDTVTEEDFTY